MNPIRELKKVTADIKTQKKVSFTKTIYEFPSEEDALKFYKYVTLEFGNSAFDLSGNRVFFWAPEFGVSPEQKQKEVGLQVPVKIDPKEFAPLLERFKGREAALNPAEDLKKIAAEIEEAIHKESAAIPIADLTHFRDLLQNLLPYEKQLRDFYDKAPDEVGFGSQDAPDIAPYVNQSLSIDIDGTPIGDVWAEAAMIDVKLSNELSGYEDYVYNCWIKEALDQLEGWFDF